METTSRKQRGAEKTARIPIKIVPAERLKKPDWIRIRLGSGAEVERFNEIKAALREHKLHTVCEEASCPNIHECFGKGTATFMIMGDICTRRCPFCDVGHGRPDALNADEPRDLANTIAAMRLNYVVITSVDRDDLRDGGAAHFVECIRATRDASPKTTIEVLVPDFRGRMDVALEIFDQAPPDVMNHNLETVPRLYKQARPGSDYAHSLLLLKEFKARKPEVLTKSGLMVGLGETDEEILEVLRDLRAHDVEMLTIGQYLQPSAGHLPVLRYVHPDTFKMYETEALKMGFRNAACGPMVRSSYWADQQAHGAGVVWTATPLDAWGNWLKGSLWAYPALEAVYIAGIALLFGSLVVLELRLLGLARLLDVMPLAQLALPVSLFGFGVAACSGLMLFAADAFDLLINPAFRLKMLMLVLAGTNAALFHATGGLRAEGVAAKAQLGLSLLLWLAVIACGRMIAYV